MKKVRNILFIIVVSLIEFLNFNISASADTKEPTCPSGYSRVGTSYTCKKDEFTGRYSCPDSSYSQPGGSNTATCVKKVYEEANTAGGIKVNGKYTASSYRCFHGKRVYNNGKTNSNAEYVCEITKTVTGKKVYSPKTAAMNKCPNGYTYNSKTRKCESKTSGSSSNSSNNTSPSSNTNTNSKPKTTTKKDVLISFTSEKFEVDAGKSKIVGIKIEGAKIKDTTVKIENTKTATVKKIKKNGKSYIQVKGKKKGKTTLVIQVKGKKEKLEIQVNKKNTQTKEENEAENVVNEGITDISQIDTNGTTQEVNNNKQIKTIKCPSKTPSIKVGKTVKINYRVNPSDANTNNIEIIVKGGSKDNIKITSKEPLKVKGLKKGTGKIVFKYNGKTTTCKIKVEKASSSTKKTSTKKSNNNPVKKITITGSSQIEKGDAKTYIANVTPSKANGKVTWKSSNTKIATVDSNGQVKAKKTGNVTITATSKENSKIKGTKKITIKKKEMILDYGPIVKVESISIPSDKSITVGGKSKLKVTYMPENSTNTEIIWKTSDKKIVTVDTNGTIVGHKTGTAIVTATSKDNKNAVSNCTITVGKKINVTGVELSSDIQTINIGEKLTINSVVLPENATNKGLSWKSSNEKVATVKNGIVTGKKKGTVTITATSKSDATKKKTIKITVQKKKSNAASKEPSKSDNITKYSEWNTEESNPSTILLVGGTTNILYLGDEGFNLLDYTYVLTDPSIISIDEAGIITALKAGTTYLKFISKTDGSQYKELLKVDVYEKDTLADNEENKEAVKQSKLTYKNTKIWPVKDLVIYKNSSGSSSTGKNVKKGSTLKILEHKNKRFKIKYNGTTGWISRSWVMIDMVTFDKRLEYPMPNASSPIYYLKDNNGNDTIITKKKLYKSKICALMYDTAIMLSKAQDKAAKDGYTLVVYDAYRPQTVTKYLYDKASDMVGSGNKYNSPLGNLLAQNVSTHNYGVAIDLTLKKNGKELNMPTKIHYIGTSAGNTNSNSKKLAKYMTSAGFDPLVSNGVLLEWWHFQNNDSINYKVNICNFNSNIQKSSSNNDGSNWNWEEID